MTGGNNEQAPPNNAFERPGKAVRAGARSARLLFCAVRALESAAAGRSTRALDPTKMPTSPVLSVDKALWALEHGRNGEAFRSLRAWALKGEANAFNPLGNLYAAGTGTRRNQVAALEWYRRGYRSGTSISALNIALIYGKAGNRRLEFRWYLRAADMSDGDAYVEVASRLISGHGVRKDTMRARRYLNMALRTRYVTQEGRENAARLLGGLRASARGV